MDLERLSEEHEKGPHETFLVILGSGLVQRYKDSNPVTMPSFDEKERLLAAIEVLKDQKENTTGFDSAKTHIILTGGDIYGIGKTVSAYSEDYLEKGFINNDVRNEISIESLETSNTVEEIEKLIERTKGLDAEVIVISSDYHLVAKKLCKEEGFKFISAEEKLRERNPQYNKIIRDRKFGPAHRKQYLTILAAQIRATLLLDLPNGREIYKELANSSHAKNAKL